MELSSITLRCFPGPAISFASGMLILLYIIEEAVAIIIEGIICFLLPTIFSYLGQSDFALDYLKNNNDKLKYIGGCEKWAIVIVYILL